MLMYVTCCYVISKLSAFCASVFLPKWNNNMLLGMTSRH
uniref:Uncharacterized protein n=1 Tax=Rhizophora mucronata TaxID=61149 RepID=A0A2P2IIP1_RHIMU